MLIYFIELNWEALLSYVIHLTRISCLYDCDVDRYYEYALHKIKESNSILPINLWRSGTIYGVHGNISITKVTETEGLIDIKIKAESIQRRERDAK